MWHRGARVSLERYVGAGEIAAPPQLPERVRAQIAVEDARGERIISWTQLVLVATFAVLYAIAPKPGDAGTSAMAPVPIALACYAVFTVVRLMLAHRGPLPSHIVALSIIADAALLVGLIWVFHLQYDQPPAFSLKVPTFAYAFVFIVLRTLRFDPRFVLMAGGAMALAWIALTFAAIAASDSGVVTRSFAAYLTGNAILIGAEIDKVLAITLVTIILAISMRRAQHTLVTAVREGAAVREVRRFLSDGVAEAVAGAARLVEAGEATRREAAIVMLDLRGFTRLSGTLQPEAVVAVLTEFHALVVPVIRRHGGVIDKFLGDGVMATFGAVAPSPTAAADALRALEEILALATDWHLRRSESTGVKLEVNGAMTAGEIVFAAIGTTERLEYTVIGDAVNTAAKLEKHNKTTRTRALTTKFAYERAVSQGYAPMRPAELCPTERVAGIAEPIDLVEVGGKAQDRTP
jgi:adenylate cyclase